MSIQILSNLNYPIGNIINQELQNAQSARIAKNLHFPNWRCILKIARTEFCPRPASRDSEWAGGQNKRRSREHSKLPKNLKTNRLEPYFGRAKEIFS